MGATMVAMVVATVATSTQLVIRAWLSMRRMRRRGRDKGTGAMGGGVAALSMETAVRQVGMRWCWTRRTFEGEGGRRWTSQAGKRVRTGERGRRKG